MKKIGLVLLILLFTSNLTLPYVTQAMQEGTHVIEQCLTQDEEGSFEQLLTSDCLYTIMKSEGLSEEQYISFFMDQFGLEEMELRERLAVYIQENLPLHQEEDPLEEDFISNEENDSISDDMSDADQSIEETKKEIIDEDGGGDEKEQRTEDVTLEEPISEAFEEDVGNTTGENATEEETNENVSENDTKVGNIGNQVEVKVPEDDKIADDLSEKEVTSEHSVQIERTSKVRYISGQGAAFNIAWGGSENKLFDLSSHKSARFDVHLTEQKGEEVWYQGMLNEQEVWINEKHLNDHTYIPYNISLEEAAQRQHGVYAVTDTYRQFVSAEYISYNSTGNYYYVNADVLNVRSGPSTAYAVVDRLTRDTRVTVRGNPQNGWYQLHWVRASVEDIAYYMNPNNFIHDERQQFQFLDLAQSSGVTVEVLNQYLEGKGTLSGQGQAFIDAGRMHGVNEIYLLSHALLETGHGTSFLASGNEYNGTIVYNMFGIGAVDACPNECGLERAYNEGWDSPYKAIVGGAGYIGNSYVKAGQNTLYKMRWNIDGLIENGRPTHQYATDIGWAFKQVNNMYNLYQEIGSYNLVLEIPRFDG
ncbi:N-acetylglucosaminidase [Shouchella miscanthi]|uniref:N-acetylglucosaminidase n=1 Tax=Shouchella miscanthi TaxID=2598861 RepID=UPI001643DD42|nr:glucosaminidase domain-containing protein [Shouchella miscanthi]